MSFLVRQPLEVCESLNENMCRRHPYATYVRYYTQKKKENSNRSVNDALLPPEYSAVECNGSRVSRRFVFLISSFVFRLSRRRLFFLWNEVVWKTNVRGNRLRKLYANKCLWKISGRYAWGEHGAYESAFQSYHKFRLDAPNEGLRRMEKILSELKKIVTSAWTGECYEDFPVPGE